jgi:hypothetical protein
MLTALLALLILTAGTGRPAAPPSSSMGPNAVLATTPLLSIREVEQACPGLMVLMPEATPEKRPGVFFVRVTVQVPCTEFVYVPRITRVKRMRLVYRTVERKAAGPVLVPVVVREKKLEPVYREYKHDESRAVYVPTEVKEVRPVYRKVSRQVPCTRDVYLPVVTRQKRTVMVYVNEPVTITRTVPHVRMENTEVRDPATGRMVKVGKPVCDHRKLTEAVDRHVLRPRVIDEDVTNYRLDRQTYMRTVDDYVLEQRVINEPSYRLDDRPGRESVTQYLLRHELVEKEVTKYRIEHRERETVTDYIPEWREVEEEVTTYRLELRSRMKSVEQYVPCHGEIFVPVTRMQPVPMIRRTWVAEPLIVGAVPGCVTSSSGGVTVICGAMANAPLFSVSPSASSICLLGTSRARVP